MRPIRLSGGVAEPFDDLVQLFLANFQALGSFGHTWQLGNALGIDEFGHRILPIMQAKFDQQRFFQEVLLETAPLAILYDQSI